MRGNKLDVHEMRRRQSVSYAARIIQTVTLGTDSHDGRTDPLHRLRHPGRFSSKGTQGPL